MKKLVFLTVALLLTMALVLPACQPATPTGPTRISLICPYSIGGSTDTGIRGITPYFQAYYGKTVINENRTGGGGQIGINFVYDKPSDGRYILGSSNTATIKKFLNPEGATYVEPFKEAFIPVAAWFSGGGNILATRKDSPIKTLDDFIAAAKKETLTLGMPDPGSSDHMNVLVMQKVFGVKFNIVPFEGGGEIVAAIRGGHVDVGIAGWPPFSADPSAFNILAQTGMEKFPGIQDVPTMDELGYPEVTAEMVIGAFVRRDTPDSIVKEMEEAFHKAYDDEGYQEWLVKMEAPPMAFKDQKAWIEFLDMWAGGVESILPELIASMKALGA